MGLSQAQEDRWLERRQGPGVQAVEFRPSFEGTGKPLQGKGLPRSRMLWTAMRLRQVKTQACTLLTLEGSPRQASSLQGRACSLCLLHPAGHSQAHGSNTGPQADACQGPADSKTKEQGLGRQAEA